MSDDDISVYPEETGAAIFPKVHPFRQSDITEEGTPLEAIGTGKELSHLPQRAYEGITQSFNSLEDYIPSKTIGNDNISLSIWYILAFNIADEVQFRRLQELVSIFDELVSLGLLFTVAQKADAW